MSVKIALLFVICLLMSCAYADIKYDASTGSFAYQRMGEQEILDLYVKKDIDSTTVRLGKLQNESDIDKVIIKLSENIEQALKILDELQKKIPKIF